MTTFLRLATLTLLIAGITGAYATHAAELSLEAPLVGAESSFSIPVVLSLEDENINVVEGSIVVPEGIVIERLSTAGSAFSLFAYGPVYEPSSRTIEFTAGNPSGIPSNEVSLLFTIEAHAPVVGSYTLRAQTVRAYVNDGTGSMLAVSTRPTEVVVGEKGSVAIDALPKNAPMPLVAEVGKDDSLFDGKWFATFYGGVRDGIGYYEIREGWWRLPVRADRYYVLEDQNLRTTLYITAVDSDGTRTSVSIPPVYPWAERAVLTLIVLGAALIAYLGYRRMRKTS
jgi:hypothetical protein